MPLLPVLNILSERKALMFNPSDLILGAKYQLAFTAETDPGYDPDSYYEGTGIYRGPGGLNYPDGTYIFELPELGVNKLGYFGIESVVAFIDNDITVLDSNENGTIALVYKEPSIYGIITQGVFVPCKDQTTAKSVFQLLLVD